LRRSENDRGNWKGLYGLIAGFTNLHWSNPIMIVVGFILLYLGIKKNFEPLLLVPIGFGAILVNIPFSGSDGGGRVSEDYLRCGHYDGDISIAHLRGHWRHDRFRASARESEDIPPRCRRTVWNFSHPGPRSGFRFYPEGSCFHRDHWCL